MKTEFLYIDMSKYFRRDPKIVSIDLKYGIIIHIYIQKYKRIIDLY